MATFDIALRDNGTDVFDITFGGGPVLIGLASETDTAFGIVPLKTKALGLTSEADSAFAMVPRREYDLGLVTETDTAFGMTWARAVALGLVSETDLAFAIASGQVVAIGLATVTDVAFAIAFSKLRAIGLTAETDVAFGITRSKVRDSSRALRQACRSCWRVRARTTRSRTAAVPSDLAPRRKSLHGTGVTSTVRSNRSRSGPDSRRPYRATAPCGHTQRLASLPK